MGISWSSIRAYAPDTATSSWPLYKHVCRVLKPYRPKEFGSLPEDRQVYVDDFFADKVLEPSAGPSPLHHAGAIRVFYRNYLLGLKRHKQHFVSAHRDDGDENPENGLDQLPEESTAAFAELAEHGLTVVRTAQSAKAFLLRCEAWVPVYLAFNFCPDKPRSEKRHHPLRACRPHSAVSSPEACPPPGPVG